MTYEENFRVELFKIQKALEAEIICGNDLLQTTVRGVYASGLMSDVLAYGKPQSVLLTGLCTRQATISAYMADFKAIVFLRGKKPTEDHRKLAEEKGIILLSTRADMFEACVRIASIIYSDVHPIDNDIVSQTDKDITTHNFHIDGQDFANSGLVSTGVKTILKTIGYDPALTRRIAISTYEGEMNVVMHALKAEVTLTAGNKEIVVIIDDEGKGIPDVEQAMQEGYTTATDDQRAMGFGAGMGLPNIKKNTDILKIASEVGKGTRVEMRFLVKS